MKVYEKVMAEYEDIFTGTWPVQEITIEKRGGQVFVDGEEAKMRFNRIQLLFVVGSGVLKKTYRLFDNRNNPPAPIAEMYQRLLDARG